MADKRRVVMDCRTAPNSNCSLTISGTEEEVLELGEQHVTSKHGFDRNDPKLREILKSSLKEEAFSR